MSRSVRRSPALSYSGWNPGDGTSRLDSAIKRLLKELQFVAPLPTKP